MKNNLRLMFFPVMIFFATQTITASASENIDSVNWLSFVKNENTSGAVIYAKPEREQLLTKSTRDYEELFSTTAKYQFRKRYWNLLRYKHEVAEFIFETGFLAGNGNTIDSNFVREIQADQSVYGLRTNAAINYSNRYYYDWKNYTLVELNAWGRYDAYRQSSEGTLIDSNGISSAYDKTENEDKLRYGFQAKAAWGVGRLNPVNHFMVAAYLLEKYYPRRVFSDEETLQVALEIGRIKGNRAPSIERLTEKESQQLADFLKSELMLKAPGEIEADWKLGEFLPRYNGNRLEFGPFFNYFNREPDFIYGAFIEFNTAKYIDRKKNREFSVALNYNRYKKENWLLLESDLGWSFYSNLKSRFTAGVKYMPGITAESFEDFGPLIHNFIPYVEYFTQMNSKMRMNIALAWNIADDEKFMQTGPEFSLSFYRSNY